VKEFFFCTKGWFTGFRKRTGLHSVLRYGEAASGDRDAAEHHREKFKKIIEEGSFVSQQAFNYDEMPFLEKNATQNIRVYHEGGDHLAWL
jgi:hypothetical protein